MSWRHPTAPPLATVGEVGRVLTVIMITVMEQTPHCPGRADRRLDVGPGRAIGGLPVAYPPGRWAAAESPYLVPPGLGFRFDLLVPSPATSQDILAMSDAIAQTV